MEFEIDSFDNSFGDSPSFSKIPIIEAEITYNDFFRNYMQPNIPCVLKNITQNWEASSNWITQQKEPNLEYLKAKYGNCDVTVYDCNKKYFNSQQTEPCSFKYFLEHYWNNQKELRYLKDWHLKNAFGDDNFYQVPIYFASDWLNEFLLENLDDDYRFVYMGQAGTWTPFHADVFNSYSWSANVYGLKKWILFPPGEENLLRDNLNNLLYDISEIYHTRKHYEIIQHPGEAIFVPSGWYHQVWNLKDTISINHNWVNGCNIDCMWLSIQQNLNCVKNEIDDCKDMDDFLGHCQIMLNASYGMDFHKFYKLITFIAHKRMAFINSEHDNAIFHGHFIGKNHARFDLIAIRRVIEKFVEHDDVKELFKSDSKQPNVLLDEIIHFI